MIRNLAVTKKFQFGIALAFALAFLPSTTMAQRGAGQGKQRKERLQRGPNAREEKKAEQQLPPDGRGQGLQPGRSGLGRGQGLGPGPGEPGNTAFERLRTMLPQEQERALRSSMFRRMPPQRQAQIRENLRRWNAMTPEQKQDLIERDRIWQQMSPEQRHRVRTEIMPRWQSMEPQRRQAIVRRLGVLRPLSTEEREAKLKDEAFLVGLTPEEREVLQTVAKLRLPPPDRENPPPPNEQPQ